MACHRGPQREIAFIQPVVEGEELTAAATERLIDGARWSVAPARQSSRPSRAPASEPALAELLGGVIGRFEGRRVEVVIRGLPVRAVLESM